MGFLTIEHYCPKTKSHVGRRLLILFFLLVVPLMIIAMRAVNEARIQALAARHGENFTVDEDVGRITVRD